MVTFSTLVSGRLPLELLGGDVVHTHQYKSIVTNVSLSWDGCYESACSALTTVEVPGTTPTGCVSISL